MTNDEFNDSVCKLNKVTEVKVKLAEFFRENDIDIRVVPVSDGEDYLEVCMDFYKDGDPISILNTKNKDSFEKTCLTYEDFLK